MGMACGVVSEWKIIMWAIPWHWHAWRNAQYCCTIFTIYHSATWNKIDIDEVLANGINIVAQQIDTYRMGGCIILHNIQQLESTVYSMKYAVILFTTHRLKHDVRNTACCLLAMKPYIDYAAFLVSLIWYVGCVHVCLGNFVEGQCFCHG